MLFSFALLTAGFSAEASRRADQPRRQQLVELISSRRTQIEQMERDLRQLRTDLERELVSVGQETTAERAAAEASRVLSLQAGATPLEGPGLEIVMSDSGRMPGPNEDPSLYRVHDVDIQLVVNTLFSLGAEAVAVNSQRIVSTTAIRGAGETIVVNFRPLAPPYAILAIGAPEAPFMKHPVARRLVRWEDLFGLGFTVLARDQLEVPAYSGQASLRHARPLRPGAPSRGDD